MNNKAEQIIDDEIRDSHQKVNDASYQLWQGLLTVNGFLITVLIGIASFAEIKLIWIRQLVFITVICLFLSSFLLIVTMLLTKQVFHKIYNMLAEAKLFDKIPNEDKNLFFASIRGLIRFIAEPSAIILQLMSFFLVLIYLYNILFISIKK